ncbi:MAG: hypothetical protein V4563_07640 [Pseudomonadota bacterium]
MKFCINSLIRALIGTTALMVANMASAVPIELTAAQFTSQTGDLATIIEDFAGFVTGNQSNPLTIANGTAIFPGVPYVLADSNFCPNGTNCLIDNGNITSPRIFSALPAGTTYWGADIGQVQFGGSDIFRVTVVGGSGILAIEAIGRDFWGFNDTLGISSVSFLNLGSGSTYANYSFDNVTTSGSVPTPSTLMLLLAGGLWFGRSARWPSPSATSRKQ